jgi:hypothetical protein
MDHSATATISSHQLEQALRAVDASAVLAPAHILRRIIRLHTGAAGFFRKTPHRKSLVIASQELLQYVDPDELDLPSGHSFSPQVLLLVRPGPDKQATMPAPRMLLEYWRLLFHARADAHMARLAGDRALDPAVAIARIHAIGQAAFDEVRSVLEKERFLLPPTDNIRVYSEFVAVYLELRHFLPEALKVYFPSIDSFDRIDRVIALDIDGPALLAATRLAGAADPTDPAAPLDASPVVIPQPRKPVTPEDAREVAANYDRLIRRADKAANVGNFARAAVTRNRAVHMRFPDDPRHARNVVRPDIEKLAHRVCRVLEIDDGDVLVNAMAGLLDPNAVGWATPGARLLYDLQAVCIDHEKDLFKLDLIAWITSRGEVPIKRKLPAAKEVRLHQHLSKAVDRLHRAKFPDAVRATLLDLLAPKLRHIEESVRDHLRPLIEQALREAGLVPASPPEEVARRKLVEELLDRIVDRGFITMGDLRDAISRNQMKLPDLTRSAFFRGDELLKIDRRLARLLDGVYRRGEVYRRVPQRLSSLAFGTRIGRFITQYIIIPYLGAFLLLESVQHIVHMFAPAQHYAGAAAAAGIEGGERLVPDPQGIHLNTLLSIFLTGSVLLWLFHAGRIRAALFRGIKWAYRRFYGIVIDLPSEILRLDWVKKLVNNRAVRLTYRFLLKPAVFGGLVWLICHTWGLDWGFSLSYALGFFIIMNLLFNTRFGRGLEEAGGDLIARIWRRFGWKVILAALMWIVDVFKWVLDAFEELRYNIDEWLRFRTGENRLAFVGKLVVGTLWFFVSYLVVFCITLLIEPQVNPIKHFPVVTVSHKVMIGFAPVFVDILTPLFGGDRGEAAIFVGSVIWLIPGIFGFLAWELKENWRLYQANRSAKLRPVIIGHHGESMLGLLKPGFHSGTVPKLYARLRKIERKRAFKDQAKAQRKHHLALHHVEEAVHRFIDRELVATLTQSKAWGGLPVEAGHVRLGGNSASVELHCPSLGDGAARLVFEEQSGWLVVSFAEGGWLARLTSAQLDAFKACLSGFYKLAAVDIVREQVEALIGVGSLPYDVDERGIVVWPRGAAEPVTIYKLEREKADQADPAGQPPAEGLPVPPPADVIAPGEAVPLLRHMPVAWKRWVKTWERDQAGQALPCQLVGGPPLVRMDRDSAHPRQG